MSGLEKLSRDELIELVLRQHEMIVALRERVARLELELEQLRSQLPGGSSRVVPDWVKPSRAERRVKPRKKRKHSFVRRYSIPTEVHEHTVEACPNCGRKLSGGWLHRRRQYVEIPDTPVRIVEHRIIRRRCGVCGKVCTPKLDLSGEVLGRHRVGISLMSFVGYLATVCRVPLRTIKGLLRAFCGVELGVGELSEMLHAISEAGRSEYEGLCNQIRGSESGEC